ncbi:MAG: hypothetical protein OXL36_18830 [Bryobacterales bacterium]|nr:hypothetical protein [Bryobacterales bacterium]MDE0296938.1 hypothetical protein [Bryobacterales bacterium]
MARTSRKTKKVEILTHGEASRKNIPTAEYQAVMEQDDRSPIRLACRRRNRDLDPHLVWSGKDGQHRSEQAAQPQPLFIQEKVHPNALLDDLVKSGKR